MSAWKAAKQTETAAVENPNSNSIAVQYRYYQASDAHGGCKNGGFAYFPHAGVDEKKHGKLYSHGSVAAAGDGLQFVGAGETQPETAAAAPVAAAGDGGIEVESLEAFLGLA